MIILLYRKRVYIKKKIAGLLVCVFMVLSLTGCGKEEIKTLKCTSKTDAMGISIEVSIIGTFGIKTEELKDYKIEYVYDYTEFFNQTGVTVTSEIVSQMKTAVKSELEEQLKDNKGLIINDVTNEGNIFYTSITSDYDTLKKEYPDKFKKDGEFTYEGFKKKSIEEQMICE